jgi:hypothetical protein
MEIDSLINSRIRIYSYKPLDLDFIEYNNRYYYQDRSDSDCYSINLIRDNKSGKYYQDFIKDDACFIEEDFCMWSSRQNIISKSEVKSGISDEAIKAYNSINSTRIYAENETHFENKKMGIQTYLNSVFKFSRPTKSQLDSLFYNYDRNFNYQRDTLLNYPNDLFEYLRVQALKIRSQPNYGDLSKRLESLKDQINLILLRVGEMPNDNLFFWIYKSNWRLRVRGLRISGNKKSTYSYYLNEYKTCF